ncbi:hypothetical protein C3K47_05825 [Solitalea longa]|uniref:Cyclic nucleotide-binding protein n=1 Tax=Solitalea longa TaxID=2079460 RepID=A0A2S5A618_9SPHI|nr:DUF1003 domain-containing protein [Solitalea longa]POY38040.1 hypothetical protein C3K47_05825 [Solitalea longa]
MNKKIENFISDISGEEFPIQECMLGSSIPPNVFTIINEECPGFSLASKISIWELNHYRQKYIEDFLLKDVTQITDLEQNVLKQIRNKSTITDKLDESRQLTFGQRLADKIADFGGSWTFIIIFLSFICVWMAVNVFWFLNKGYDPYPFILLNLILSCLAALQAPVIMMSQNRQEEKDRQRAKQDYMINLKSELEIRMLHEKIDHLIIHQQQELIQIQKIQMDMMDEIINEIKSIKTQSTG